MSQRIESRRDFCGSSSLVDKDGLFGSDRKREKNGVRRGSMRKILAVKLFYEKFYI